MHSTKIFLDGADLGDVKAMSGDANISGFTSNPSLMTKSGITNYDEFIKMSENPEKDFGDSVNFSDKESKLKRAFRFLKSN